MKATLLKSGLAAAAVSVLLLTGCASSSTQLEAVDAKAAQALQVANDAKAAADRAQSTATAAQRTADEANQAIIRLSETCCRK